MLPKFVGHLCTGVKRNFVSVLEYVELLQVGIKWGGFR